MQETPAGAETVKVTVPAKPLLGVMVMVVVAEEPLLKLWEDELSVTAKSGVGRATTCTVIVAVWERVPLAPVTVTM